MKWFYSPSTNGFYSDARFTAEEMPDDVTEISAERRDELLAAQDMGKVIRSRGGVPAAFTPAEPTGQDLVDFIHRQRREAYQTEADSMYLEWQYDKTAESETAWRDKVAEIKKRFPLPLAE